MMIHYVWLSTVVYRRRIFCSWSMHLSTFNCHSVMQCTPFSFLLTRLPTYYLIICLHLVPNYPPSIDLLSQRYGFPTQPLTHPYSKWVLSSSWGMIPIKMLDQCFFFPWWNFAKFRPPKKYDFELYKDFPWKKMAQIRQFSKKKIQIAKFLWEVLEGSWEYRKIMFVFLLSYLVCSQIWLNHLMDDQHFSYITKLGGKKKQKTPPCICEDLQAQSKETQRIFD
jgi:hypothetical protein